MMRTTAPLPPHDAPLVSVAMPAYKAQHLAAALDSLAAQTWPWLELVICDDSAGEAVRDCVEAFAARAGFPVHYHRNPERLHESRNAARCVALARGAYIKFLYDDDVLEPECIARQVAVLRDHGDIALVTARRRRIDLHGARLPDTLHTAALFEADTVLDGPALVRFLGQHTHNFIGEPSAVMCRRADLLDFGPRLMDLDGEPIQWFGDLALYAKLLHRGDLAWLSAPLSRFRVSLFQFSQIGRDRPGIGDAGLARFRTRLQGLGWSDASEDARQVPCRPLEPTTPARPLDLVALLAQADARSRAQAQLDAWQQPRRLNATGLALAQARLQAEGPARLCIVLDARGRSPQALRDSLDSLAAHGPLFASLRVCVFGAEGPLPDEVQALPVAPGLAPALNRWLAEAEDDDWLLLAAAGDVFCAGGLQRLALALAGDPPFRALFADEWQRGGLSTPAAPVLRPDFNLDLLLGHPGAMGRHWVLRRRALAGIGGFDAARRGAWMLDALLRLVEHGGYGDLAHLPEPLLYCEAEPADDGAQSAVLLAHLHRRGYADAAVATIAPGLYRLAYGHAQRPRVSLLLVADAATAPALLQRCVLSVLEKTAYADYEVLLVDNGVDAATAQWMQQAAALAAPRLRAFALDGRPARTAALNLAASQASGDFLLFLRAETAVVQPPWLDALLEHGLRPEVGIVGARTVSAEGRISHAGLLPGMADGGGRAFLGEPMEAPGYLGRLRVAHAYSAVSDSCLLIGRARFQALGGFDADAFPGDGADIDLCLRSAADGALTVWTPDALLLHGLDATALEPPAREALLDRWLPALARDPAYHPSLQLAGGGFRLGETGFSWHPLPWQPLPRVLAHPADAYGSGHYRVMQPLAALRAAGTVEGCSYAHLLDEVELARVAPDVLILQRRVDEDDLARMRRLPRHSQALKVYELDDYLPNLPAKSAHRADMPRDILRTLRRALSLADRFVVSTEALAEAFAGFHEDIRVAPNRLPPHWWTGLPGPRRNLGPRPRVGWAGGLGHAGDLALIAELVRELAGEVDWVFLGLCPEALRPYVAEFHPGVDIAAYPRTLALLRLDLALAPLEANRFNECKSNLRLLEYGACGYPVVCSDVGPYRAPLPGVTRVKNRHRDWIAAIREHLGDADARAAAGDRLRDCVRADWMLAGEGLSAWRRAWLP